LCPLDRLLVETDAPFLAPMPHRGKTNEPAWVPLVGACVAAAQGVAPAIVEAATWANTERVFGL
jgi:TatD DNase family protein